MFLAGGIAKNENMATGNVIRGRGVVHKHRTLVAAQQPHLPALMARREKRLPVLGELLAIWVEVTKITAYETRPIYSQKPIGRRICSPAHGLVIQNQDSIECVFKNGRE